MKRFILLLIFSICCAVLPASAQFAALDRHPQWSLDYDAIFVDVVKHHVTNVVKSSYGQYFGQLAPGGDIYGYGTFYTDQNGEVYGLFHNGNLLMGLRLGVSTVKVGSESHYIVYDLVTSAPIYIYYKGEKYPLNADHQEQWRFVQMTYQNGDKYVGETVKGKRDGYGLYYYTNGDYYFGRYSDNRPVGYGALFHADNRISIQNWEDE